MAPMEAAFFWATLVIYALTSGGYIYALVFRNDRILDKLLIAIGAGFVLHTLAIAARYYATGHLPWSGDYENSLMGGWFIVLFTLVTGKKHQLRQLLAAAILPLVLLIMGFGVMRDPELSAKAMALKSFWLYIHVYFAWLAFGAYTMAMAAGVMYLLKLRDINHGMGNPIYEKLPSIDRLEELIFRYVIFGFITDAIMIAAGAIWAKDLWGSYWSWDPVETWSLVSWLIYGVAIHLRVTMGWRGVRLAWLVILALTTVLISFFGVNFVVDTSLHMFNVR